MKYIASFVRKDLFYDFCLPELLSVCEMFKVPIKYDNNFCYDLKRVPLISIEYPNIENDPSIAEKIVNRAVLTKNIIKIISEGKTYEELLSNVDKNSFLSEGESLESFRFDIDCRGRVMSQDEKLDIIQSFSIFNFKAKVDIKKAKRIFVVIDNHINGEKYFGKLIAGKSDDALFYSKYNLNTRKYLGPTSTDNVLGFIMCNLGQVQKNTMVLDPFVGTGSLLIPPSYFGAICTGCDIDLRVIKGLGVGYTKPGKLMKNEKLQKVQRNSDIFTNFNHYGFKLPQILRSDINLPAFRRGEAFDSIVCDPPYGFRAFTRKTGMNEDKKARRVARLRIKYGKIKQDYEAEGKAFDEEKMKMQLEQEAEEESLSEDEENEIEDSLNSNLEKVVLNQVNEEKMQKEKNIVYLDNSKQDLYNFTPLKQCSVENIFESLLKLGDNVLKKDGCLVCLYPTKIKKGDEDIVHKPVSFPQNKNFDLVHAIENPYSLLKSRWCLVYKKK